MREAWPRVPGAATRARGQPRMQDELTPPCFAERISQTHHNYAVSRARFPRPRAMALLALVACMGRAQGEAKDYFLAGGKIPRRAAACSFVATAMTAASVLGCRSRLCRQPGGHR